MLERGEAPEARAGAAVPAAAVRAAGERAPAQPSHAGRERRVAACARNITLHSGIQGAPPSSLQSQHNFSVRSEGCTSARRGASASVLMYGVLKSHPCNACGCGSPREKHPGSLQADTGLTTRLSPVMSWCKTARTGEAERTHIYTPKTCEGDMQ